MAAKSTSIYLKMRIGVLLTFLCFVTNTSTLLGQKSFVRFEKPPTMVLSDPSGLPTYQIKYQSTTKSTIYLELKKDKKVYARGHYQVDGKQKGEATIRIKPCRRAVFKPSNAYSYRLYMYAGEPNDWSRKACQTKTVTGVQITKQANMRVKTRNSPTPTTRASKTNHRMMHFTRFFQ